MNQLRSALTALIVLCAMLVAPVAIAQDNDDSSDSATTEESASSSEDSEDGEDVEGDEDEDEDEDEDGDADAEEEEEEEAEERVSSDGSYEFKRAYGGGVELGVFFNELARYNTQLLNPANATPFDVNAVYNLDLSFELSYFEGYRFALFGGLQGPFSSDPGLRALYIGLEPSFDFRRAQWEMALGLGVAIGSLNLTSESAGRDASSGLVVLRPFYELRYYVNENIATYGRVGFNYWASFNVDDSQFPDRNEGTQQGVLRDNDINEGGIYLALGARFGNFPEPIKSVPDTDGDGIKDDIDDEPEEPEDMDGFQDEDGAPDPDNDEDGILDADDECPNEAEDLEGFDDLDGCPETDDDRDGDGILDVDDAAPTEPEDKDGFEDEDGKPDPDNDGDGILDADDKCPLEAGVERKAGCPLKRIEITLDKIEINEKIFFETAKADIKPESFGLLDELATILNENPQIKKVEVQGHTDSRGKASKNQKLSQDRAKSVVTYLVSKGVDAKRLTSKGFGSKQPLVPTADGEEETDEAAAKNRRVEFVILEQDEVKEVREE